jgi:hypothetical protein
MMHLSQQQLVDLVEDPTGATLAPDRRLHLAKCESCRDSAAALRALLDDVSSLPGGAPSPLFWDHFPARVADAVAGERPGDSRAGAYRRFGARAAAWATVAVAMVAGMTTVVWRTTLHAPTATSITAYTAAAGESATADDSEADPEWNVVRAAADGVTWDDAEDAEIAARPGTAERAVMELTPDERAELARLLETEMKQRGA